MSANGHDVPEHASGPSAAGGWLIALQAPESSSHAFSIRSPLSLESGEHFPEH